MESLILFSPLVSFVLVGLFGRRIGDLASAILTILGGAFAFIFSLQALPKAL
ncbi:hypothetical protein SAMN05444391_1539, partial [Thermocrinis minervae]